MELNLGLVIRDGKAVVSSRDIARVFEKRHDHVIRDIRAIIEKNPEWTLPNFGEAPYTDPQNGQTFREYLMTRDGFTLLVMGYTGESAMRFKIAYIAAFNEMEERLKTPLSISELVSKPQLLMELLTKHIQTIHENEQLKLTEAKYEGQTNTVGLYKVGEIAEELGISARKLNDFLCEQRIQYRPNGSKTWRLYTEYIKDNLAHPRLVKLDNGYETPVLLWTAKGRDFIFDLVEREIPEWSA